MEVIVELDISLLPCILRLAPADQVDVGSIRAGKLRLTCGNRQQGLRVVPPQRVRTMGGVPHGPVNRAAASTAARARHPRTLPKRSDQRAK